MKPYFYLFLAMINFMLAAFLRNPNHALFSVAVAFICIAPAFATHNRRRNGR